MGFQSGAFSRRSGRNRKKPLMGAVCILSGVLVMILFVPGWLVAIIVAFLLFSLGAALIGYG